MKQNCLDTRTLVLAVIAGLATNGSFNALFSDIIPFSIFPFLTLALSAYFLQRRYLGNEMKKGMPMLSVSCFLLGLVFNSVISRMEYPELGSSTFLIILSLMLVVWVIYRSKKLKELAEFDREINDLHEE